MTSRIREIEIPDRDIFANDSLDRQPYVRFIATMLDKTTGPFTISLDSPWGTGKTATIRMLKALMEEMDYKCLYFNAWKADHISDPLIPLVSEIVGEGQKETDVDPAFAKVKKTVGKLGRIVLHVGTKVASAGLVDAGDVAEAILAEGAGRALDTVVDSYLKQEELVNQLREELELAVSLLPSKQQKEKLIFFVDELDRCRPTFAVDLLERIKHIFDVPNVIFVLSLDAEQLSASVKSVYGEGFDSHRYLQRFFDLSFNLPAVSSKDFVKETIVRSDFSGVFLDSSKNDGSYTKDLAEFVDIFSVLADLFDLSLRDKERCITRLGLVLEQIDRQHNLHPIYIAIFVVLRAVNHSLFRSILLKEREPLDFDELIKSHPKYKSHYENGEASFDVVHDYLLVADMASPKAKGLYADLRKLATRENDDSPECQDAASQLTSLSNLSHRTPRPTVFYGLLKKIDLAGNAQ
jgi:hypothetical protein